MSVLKQKEIAQLRYLFYSSAGGQKTCNINYMPSVKLQESSLSQNAQFWECLNFWFEKKAIPEKMQVLFGALHSINWA